ncbi:MAG TPA: hypothetical protein VK358_00360 [Longimicrobium sp.]|nr:hypothetical protein [Longimicrobium sp.]
MGVLRPRHAGECFVITPQHVIAGLEDSGEPTMIHGPGELSAEVELETSRYSTDVSILRFRRAQGRIACPEWPRVDNVNLILRRAMTRETNGFLVGWGSEVGPVTRTEVEIVTVDETQIGVRAVRGEIVKGMSGSLVYVGDAAVGMLITASSEGDATLATVLRLDYIERHLGTFFHPMISPSHARIVSSIVVPGLGQDATRRRGTAVAWFGAAAAAAGAALLYPRNETVTLTGQTPTGETYEFTRNERTYPLRRHWWGAWLVVGGLSAAESYRYADRHYMPPKRSASVALQLSPAIQAAPGGVQVQVAELRF